MEKVFLRIIFIISRIFSATKYLSGNKTDNLTVYLLFVESLQGRKAGEAPEAREERIVAGQTEVAGQLNVIMLSLLNTQKILLSGIAKYSGYEENSM